MNVTIQGPFSKFKKRHWIFYVAKLIVQNLNILQINISLIIEFDS